MEREARSSGIEFLAELEQGVKPVLSDPSQLQQVLLNRVTNAVDAHDYKPYGTIRIFRLEGRSNNEWAQDSTCGRRGRFHQ